jgi:hypothetical protein
MKMDSSILSLLFGIETPPSIKGGITVQTKFPRPCLNCGVMHTHNNAFDSAECCKEWNERNPNQGRKF